MSDAVTNRVAESPCIGVCTMHDSGYCLGCWRSLDEITHWLEFSHEQRRTLMQTTLQQRQQAYFDGID